MSHAIELTAATFESEVLQSPIPVLVDFWAPWCGPCRMMAPILDELATELDGRVKITKLNVDLPEHQSFAMQYRVSGIPNMQLFTGGQVKKEFVGARPKEELKSDIEKELA